jgi:hypothetical protein
VPSCHFDGFDPRIFIVIPVAESLKCVWNDCQ